MEPIPTSTTEGAASPFRRPSPLSSLSRPAGFGPLPPAPLTSAAPRMSSSGRTRAGAAAGLDRVMLERRRRSGALWFYWVAALSLVNSLVALTGQEGRFIIGLGITQVADALAARSGHGVAVVALVDATLVGGFALLGRFAQRGRLWAFGLGAAVYAVDGLVFLAAHHWIGVAFHVFVLVMAVRGMDAAHRLA